MRHPIIRSIHAYWTKLAAGRIAPNRTEIDPRALGTALGDIFLLDGPETASNVRLAGSRITQWLGREPTGKPFAAMFPEGSRESARASLQVAAMEGEPILFGLRLAPTEEPIPLRRGPAHPEEIARRLGERREPTTRISGELVLLPLFHQGRVGARILGAMAFSTPLHQRPREPLALAMTGTRVLGQQTRPATPLGLVSGGIAETVISRHGHLTLMRGFAEKPSGQELG